MPVLYHFVLCPFSRKIRVGLTEKGIIATLQEEPFWERREELGRLNPAMQVPVLAMDDVGIFCDSNAIMEYLETTTLQSLMTGDAKTDAEVRRLIGWFDTKFYQEVTRYLLNEKLLRYYKKQGEPCSDALRAAKANLEAHMRYLSSLIYDKRWFVNEQMTWADITIAAHLSTVDYFGEIDWNAYEPVKEWYMLIKSRPSFRPLLKDRVRGFHPPACYANLDF